ncbi:MAG: hypothetical protein AB7F89_07855 [Pirellulaceae bacterium]
MSRRRTVEDVPIGQDSFLDIVSNLVGILIILVMVVGARAKDALLHAGSVPNTQATTLVQTNQKELAAAVAAAKNVEADIHRIDHQIDDQELEVRYRQNERDRAQLLVTAAEQLIAERRAKLDESQQREFDERRELAAAESQLRDLTDNIEFTRTSLPQTTVLEHLPTPMAKTVFGRELHVRLKGGRLMYVPWDDFIQLLKEDAPRKVWRLKDQDELTELVGPLGGFWMRYTLRRETQLLQTKVGVAAQQSVTLDRFTLVPENEELGEPLADALQPGSRFATLLSSYRPDSTTITAWTYPDSFGQFRDFKRQMFERGYVTAARPLPADHPIGGSPDGTRSAAQ